MKNLHFCFKDLMEIPLPVVFTSSTGASRSGSIVNIVVLLIYLPPIIPL